MADNTTEDYDPEKATAAFNQRYVRFGRRQKFSVGLLVIAVVLVSVAGLWVYGLGLAMGWIAGYGLGRARGHMETAKAYSQNAVVLDHLDKLGRKAIAEAIQAGFDAGQKAAASGNN